MNKKAALQIIQAATFGMQAFNAGKKCVPCHDANVMAMLKGRMIGETPDGSAPTAKILDAWIESFMAAKHVHDSGRIAA